MKILGYNVRRGSIGVPGRKSTLMVIARQQRLRSTQVGSDAEGVQYVFSVGIHDERDIGHARKIIDKVYKKKVSWT
eukprot:scaffold193894_cov20-Tisochrysis_lutea.AAC.3